MYRISVMYFCDAAELTIDKYKYAVGNLFSIYFSAFEEDSTKFRRLWWIIDLTNYNPELQYGIDITDYTVVFRSHYRI